MLTEIGFESGDGEGNLEIYGRDRLSPDAFVSQGRMFNLVFI